jgi:phosphatidylglycerol:prolipoprotein diacylglycerol transferase
MYPFIFTYKFITIGTFGALLGLAFYMGFLLLEREMILRGKDPELAYKLLLTIIPSAIVGAKIFHILENYQEFLRAPMDMLFSGAGLSVYGGFILSFATSILLIRKNKESILEIFDITTPTMALGYAIGRIGCHLAGDGCYGINTDTLLGISYPNGIVPVSHMVLPTPLFESFASFLIFIALMKLRKLEMTRGKLFFLYIILNGIARFLIEFIRINPKILPGISHAQVTGILFVITGIIGWIMVDKKRREA